MLYNALCMFYIYFSFTFIIEYNSVLFPKSRLSDFPQLHSSDRAITFYFFLQIFRFTEQFEPGKIGSHIQIIYITEYLGRLKLIFTFSNSCPSTNSCCRRSSSSRTAASARSRLTPAEGFPAM